MDESKPKINNSAAGSHNPPGADFYLDLVNDAVIISNADDIITDWNLAAERIYGWTADEVSGKLGLAILQTEWAGGNEEEMRRGIDESGFWHGEALQFRKNGERVYVESSVSALKNQNNEISGLITINRDVTEIKKNAETARKEKERLEILLDLHIRTSTMDDTQMYDFILDRAVKLTQSEIGFFHRMADDQNAIILTTWNSKALENCTAVYDNHYPIEQAGNWVDCIREKRPIIYNDYPNSPNRKGLPSGHSVVKRFMSIPVLEGGKVRYVFGVGNKLSDYDDNDVLQLQIVAHELHKIIQQRNAEDTLREHEQRLKVIFGFAGVPMAVAGLDGRWLETNRAFQDMFGYTEAELAGLKIGDLIHPDDLSSTIENIVKLKSGLNSFYRMEKRYLRKNGTLIWIDLSVTPLIDSRGNIYAVIGAGTEITKRKEAEQALRDNNEFITAVLDSIFACVAVLNPDGCIKGANQPWKEAVLRGDMFTLRGADENVNYLEVLKNVSGENSKVSQLISSGLIEVLACQRKTFEMEYKAAIGSEIHWFAVRADSFSGVMKGAVVSHADITRLKKVELELEEKINELERFNRVMVGRELKMIELKEEVRALSDKLGLPPTSHHSHGSGVEDLT